MINNFKIIEPLLNFDNPGDCYFLQILKRQKDNPDLERNMEVIDNMLIYSLEDYYSKQNKIISICKTNNARAYLRLNRRNTEQLALATLSKIASLLLNKDYKAVKNAYWSAAGNVHSEPTKRWIVDIDRIVPPHKWDEYVNNIRYIISDLHDECNGKSNQQKYKQLLEIPTKNGIHLITHPFNLQEFRKRCTDAIDIHKDNPSILFQP